MKKIKDFIKSEDAQVSVELIIIFAVLVTIAYLIVSSFYKTTQKGERIIDKKVDKTFDKISKIKK